MVDSHALPQVHLSRGKKIVGGGTWPTRSIHILPFAKVGFNYLHGDKRNLTNEKVSFLNVVVCYLKS